MSCVPRCCTPSSHALVLTAQPHLPRRRRRLRRVPGLLGPAGQVPVSVPTQCRVPAPLLARCAPTRCAAGALACPERTG